eukprot:Hpha_TRINITY_DN17004_c0_g1::TRINITY_DN17004_c0_g1_i1::g.166253::m.166253
MAKCAEACCLKCSNWIIRSSDSMLDIQIKRSLTPALIVLSCAVSLGILYDLNDKLTLAWTLSMVMSLVAYFTFFIRGMLGRDMGASVDMLLFVLCIANCLQDSWTASEARPRNWSFVVIYLDIALVFNRPRFIPFIILFTLIYLFVESTESTFRFGLYDLVASMEPPVCNCADPPCSQTFSVAFFSWIWGVLILVVDFYLTRRFASELRIQLRRVKSSVEVAVEISAALAKYDIGTAEEAIARGDDLPEELGESYQKLLSNLRSYKPYLPHSCLLPDSEGPPSTARLSTAVPSGVSTTPYRETPSPCSDDARLRRRCSGVSSSPSNEGRPVEATSEDSSGPSAQEQQRDSGVSSQSSSSVAVSKQISSLRMKPKRSRVTLAAGNMLGYLASCGDLGGNSHNAWMAKDVEQWWLAVVKGRGVVDLIAGDRRYASFNARQTCGG